MKSPTCINCSKSISRKSKLCRSCFELGTKTKRNCSRCGKPLSISAAATNAIFCRKCYDFNRSHRNEVWLNKNWLMEQFLQKKLSILTISQIAGCSDTTISKWLQNFGIIPKQEWVKEKQRSKRKKPISEKRKDRGYIVLKIKNDPRNKRQTFSIREHQFVMEQHLGRFLTKEERVHHKNAVRDDNRIDNLQLFPDDKSHQQYERLISFFAKQLLWGDLHSELKPQLLDLFMQFLSKNGYRISG